MAVSLHRSLPLIKSIMEFYNGLNDSNCTAGHLKKQISNDLCAFLEKHGLCPNFDFNAASLDRLLRVTGYHCCDAGMIEE
jgi:hypothetical protein